MKYQLKGSDRSRNNLIETISSHCESIARIVGWYEKNFAYITCCEQRKYLQNLLFVL